MATVHVRVMAGLGYVASEGITEELLDDIKHIQNVSASAHSHTDYLAVVDNLKRKYRPGDKIVLAGHSLGAGVVTLMALLLKLSGIPVTALFGFDPADNIAANVSQYRIIPIPDNVAAAQSWFVPGGGLGGGTYVREEGNTKTKFLFNDATEASHTRVDNVAQYKLTVSNFIERIAEAIA